MAVDKFYDKVVKSIQRTNQYAGEAFISDARQTNTYVDKTANLRNSIGYAVTDGEVNAGGGEGGSEARRYMTQLKGGIDQGLIMVAGMTYAAAVEAKGYDVITESVKMAITRHKRMLEKNLKV